MIISYRRRFTFLHCPKTAGTSVNVALAPHLGPFDIILGAQRERVNAGIRPNLRARFDAIRTGRPTSVLEALGVHSPRRTLISQDKSYLKHFGPIVDHPQAIQVRAFDRTAWDRHFKFSFVRNPYERMVSVYLFLTRKSKGEKLTFSDFVSRLIEGADDFRKWRSFVDTWPIYTIDDRIVVDYVGRFENLSADFSVLCDQLKLPSKKLGQTKVMPRYDFRDVYDARSRKLVARFCGREIEHFGYRFGQ
jgi:hypothetical protein